MLQTTDVHTLFFFSGYSREMEFVIPLNQKGLLEPSGTNQYVVDEVFPVRQLTEIIISKLFYT